MLKFYHIPLSFNSRRVWITLLEKELPFEEVIINLGESAHLKPEFLAINPFQRIPVLEDDGFRMVESLAILDYLEAKYPTPGMLPTSAKALTTVRMVQLVTANELLPKLLTFMSESEDSPKFARVKHEIHQTLIFLTEQLDDTPYFGSQQLTLADIVAGTVVPLLPMFGIPLSDYSKLNDWCDRLMSRPVFRQTEVKAEYVDLIKQTIKKNVRYRPDC